MQLYVFDSTLTIEGIIERYQKATWTRHFFRPGSLTLLVNRNATGADLLALRSFVALDDDEDGVIDRAYLIEQIELVLDENGQATEMVQVWGRDVLALPRIVIPPDGQSHDAQNGIVAETSIKHYVDDHAGPSAPANRQIPNLVIATDQGRGTADTERARYHDLVAILERISLRSGMGYEVTFDPTVPEHVFDVVPGVDRSGSVFLDVDFDTVRQQKWLSSEMAQRTFAVVAGQGEGSARTIAETFLAGTEPAGLDRRELFVDARDIEDGADTVPHEERGKAKLAETESSDLFETDVAQFGSFRYREHFDLGDLVTVRNTRWGLEQSARIVTVTSDMTPALSLRTVKVELGRPFPTIKDLVALPGEGSAHE